MKRILVFLMAMTMLACTACSPESEHPDPEETPAETVSAPIEADNNSEPQETAAPSETLDDEESTDAEPTETESADSPEASGYEEAVRAYYTYLSERNLEGLLHLTYPEVYTEIFQLSAEAQGYSLSDILDSFEDNGGQIRLESMSETEAVSAEDCAAMGRFLGEFRYQFEYIQTHGIESVLSGKYTEMDPADVEKYAYHIPEAYLIDCNVVMDDGDGEESDVQTLLAYYIEDEGWKIEASMLTYVRKSKQAAVNADAKTIYNAAATAAIEIDSEGGTLPASAIISSDSSKESGADAAFSAEFKKKMLYYFDMVQAFDYFIVFKDGTISCIVCRDTKYPDYIGRYPDTVSSGNTLGYEEMYQSFLSELN